MKNKINNTTAYKFSIVAAGLGFAMLLSAAPAQAVTYYGQTVSTKSASPNNCRSISGGYECFFPTVPPFVTLNIQYASMQCGSTGGSLQLQEFMISTQPTVNFTGTEPTYQIPLTNQNSIGNVVTAGSPTNIYAAAGTIPTAYVYLTTVPSGTQCSVSLSGLTQ